MAKASKLVLGKKPKYFTREVAFPMLNIETGETVPGMMEVKYFYRTRKEYAQLADETQAEITAKATAEVELLKQNASEDELTPQLTQADFVARQDEFKADYLQKIMAGWNVELPFGRDALLDLVGSQPAAEQAIISTYRDAIMEGRLGNFAQ